MSVRLAALAAAAIASVALAACTAKENEGGGREVARDSAGAAKPEVSAGANVVTVTAKDYTFDAPAELPAGLTTFRLVNQGPDLHHVQLIKLEDGKTADDLLAAIKSGGPPPKWAKDAGGVNPPPGGGEANATFTLEPGTYAYTCFIPTAKTGMVPHIAKGMIRPLTVRAAGSRTAPEPQAHIVMKLVDYDFPLSERLTPGTHTIKVENAGPQPHEVAIFRLAPGKKIPDVLAWFEKEEGPPPFETVGGVAVIQPGKHAFITHDFPAGDYALFCFVPDTKDGKPHFAHGMMKQIKIG